MTTTDTTPVTAPATRRSATFWILVAAFAISVIVYFYGAYQSRFNVSNIDGISYMSIARQYAQGHGGYAVNAYWSPMISWLMAPLIGVGVPPIFAFDLVNAVFATAGTALGEVFVWRRTNRSFWATALFLFVAVVFYASNLWMLTPDMLVATWIILFVCVLTWVDEKLSDAPSTRRILVVGAILGAVCAFGYLIKLFLVPVFAVTIIAWLLIRIVRRRGTPFWPRARSYVLGTVSAVVVVVILSAPWATTLSVKYGMPTVGSSFAVNVSAKFEPTAAEAAANALKLYPPPNKYALSFGEDRTDQVKGDGFQSKSSVTSRIVYYLRQRNAAFPSYIRKIESIAPFAVLIMVAFVLALIFRFARLRDYKPEGIFALTFWVYFIGYAGITSVAGGGGNSRYYWPLLILPLMLVAAALPRLWKSLDASGSRLKAITFVVLVALLPISVFDQLALGKHAPFSTVPAAAGIGYLANGGNEPEGQKFAETTLAKYIKPDNRIVGSNYRQSLRYAYYLNAQIYGRASQGYNVQDPKFQAVLRKNRIQYYLLYTPVGQTPYDLTSLGTVVGQYQQQTTCSDDKITPVVPCDIEVIKVSY